MVVPVETSTDVLASMFLKIAPRHSLHLQLLQDRGSESARCCSEPTLPRTSSPVLQHGEHKFNVEGLRKGAHESDGINKTQDERGLRDSRRTSASKNVIIQSS